MAASNISHRLSMCQVVHNKRLLSEIVFWLEFEFMSFVIIWVVEFCHNLSCRILSQFEFLKLVKLWVEFCPNSSFRVLLQLHFLFIFCNYLSFWFWVFVTVCVFEFFHNFSLWVLSQFNLISFFLHHLSFGFLSHFDFF